MHLLKLHKKIIFVSTISVFLVSALYFSWDTLSATVINRTITSRPSLEDGLVGHWTFDGGDMLLSSSTAEVRDRSGQGNHGNMVGTGFGTNSMRFGKIGQALDFDGVDDYVNAGQGTSLNVGTGDFTVGFWLRAPTGNALAGLVAKRLGVAENENGWGIGTRSGTNNCQVHISDGGGNSVDDTTVNCSGLYDGEWHHVVVLFDRSDVASLYLDGTLKDVTASIAAVGSSNGTNVDFTIGAYHNANLPADGSIDDVRLYNRALSADEISKLYHLGATTKLNQTINSRPSLTDGLIGHWTFDGRDILLSSTTAEVRDRSSSGNHGDWLNATGTQQQQLVPGRIGQAMQFDGANDNVDLRDDSDFQFGTGDFSISVWYYVDGTVRAIKPIISKRINSNPFAQYGIFFGSGDPYGVDSSSTKAFFFLRPDTGGAGAPGAQDRNASSSALTVGWHHILAVEDYDTAAYLYVDGVLVSTDSLRSHSSKTFNLTGAPLYIGFDNGSTYLPGNIDDARVYNRVLSADEASKLYHLGATTHINQTITSRSDLNTGLIAHWTFDGKNMLLTSSTAEVRDTSGQGNQGDWQNATGTQTRQLVPGRIGQAMDFDGANDFVEAGDLFYSDTLTVCAWFKYDTNPGANSIVVKRNSSGVTVGNGEWAMYVNANVLAWNAWKDNGNTGVVSVSASVRAGIWYHGCGVQRGNGNIASLYLDGAEASTSTQSAAMEDETTRVQIGVRTNSDNTRFWDGLIDDVRIYNRALSATEVQQLYQLGR